MDDDDDVVWLGDQVLQDATEQRYRHMAERLDRLYRAATGERQHLWVAALIHLVDPPLRSGTIFNVDSLLGPPEASCFVCDQRWSEATAAGPCPGDPDA